MRTKVATIVGAPTTVENRFQESRPLAYIYFKRRFGFFGKRELVVQPAAQEYAAFAEEAKRRILERMERDPIHTFAYPDLASESEHARRIVGVKDPDLLEGIAYSLHLWGLPGGNEVVANHYVLPSYGSVEVRKI